MLSRFFFIILLFSASNAVWAQSFLSLSKDSIEYPLGRRVSILAYAGKMGLQAALTQKFALSTHDSPHHGYSRSNYWFRVGLVGKAETVAGKEWLLEMKNPNIDTLEVFFVDEQNRVLAQYLTGDRFPFAHRAIRYHKFIFAVPFGKSERVTAYINMRGFYAKAHDLRLIEKGHLFQDMQYQMVMAVFLYTILIALALYNLMLYVSLRDITYFYYIAYLAATAIHLLAASGLGYQFLYPHNITLANCVANASAVLGGSFTVLFTYHFLHVWEILPKWTHWVCYVLAAWGFAAFGAVLVGLWIPSIIPSIMMSIALQMLSTLPWVIFLGFWAWFRGSRPAMFFLLAWAAMFLGTSLATLVVLGWEIGAFFNDYGVQVGSSLEALLLSFGLADRIKIMEKEKREAQQATIAALRENEEIIRHQNQILEEKVKERTYELAEANEDLATINEELNQMNEELQTTIEVVNVQKVEIEEKNRSIMDSIRYAKHIQSAILPTEEDFTRLLPEHFILFRPRDTVSGDFYYLAEQQGRVILAAVDCTGHGVPGAFMSMIGKELLDLIILDHGIAEPDLILNELHKGIRKTLKQEISSNTDGMDLSLIAVDRQAGKVFFAGAKNSILYTQGGAVERMKADLFAIGGEQREAERIFQKQTIDLLPDTPTQIYLFSDGFQDQFGGDVGKKFSFAKLKQSIEDVKGLDMPQQGATLLRYFEDWIGKGKQIDDVMLMGVRLA